VSLRSGGLLKKLNRSGKVPALHVGRRVRVRRSDFEALIERGRTVRPAEPEMSSGQAFWEGEMLAAPIVEPGDGE
jgi:hypothetical protein